VSDLVELTQAEGEGNNKGKDLLSKFELDIPDSTWPLVVPVLGVWYYRYYLNSAPDLWVQEGKTVNHVAQ